MKDPLSPLLLKSSPPAYWTLQWSNLFFTSAEFIKIPAHDPVAWSNPVNVIGKMAVPIALIEPAG